MRIFTVSEPSTHVVALEYRCPPCSRSWLLDPVPCLNKSSPPGHFLPENLAGKSPPPLGVQCAPRSTRRCGLFFNINDSCFGVHRTSGISTNSDSSTWKNVSFKPRCIQRLVCARTRRVYMRDPFCTPQCIQRACQRRPPHKLQWRCPFLASGGERFGGGEMRRRVMLGGGGLGRRKMLDFAFCRCCTS